VYCQDSVYRLVLLLLFWHAPLGVRSAIRRHQSPQRTVLGQIDCFVQCEVVGFRIALDGVQPPDTRIPWWSLPVIWWGSRYNHLGICVIIHTCAHTRALNGPFSETTRVSQYQKGKTNLDFTEARDSEWQWHQLGHMLVCTLLQTDNHASTPPLSFLQAGCPSCRPTNSVKAVKGTIHPFMQYAYIWKDAVILSCSCWLTKVIYSHSPGGSSVYSWTLRTVSLARL